MLAELLEAPTVRWQGFARIRRVALARLGHARGTEAAWRDTLGGEVKRAGGLAGLAGRGGQTATAVLAAAAMLDRHAWDAPLPRNPFASEGGVLV